MRKKDTTDVLLGAVAAAADACGVVAGFLLATWIRFDSGWVSFIHGESKPHALYQRYAIGDGGEYTRDGRSRHRRAARIGVARGGPTQRRLGRAAGGVEVRLPASIPTGPLAGPVDERTRIALSKVGVRIR